MSDEELILFEIAYSLGLPVYKLLNEMPYEEFLSWISYFEKRPIGWREDLRTAHLMRTFGDKRQPIEMFPSIKAVYSFKEPDPIDSLKNSFLFSMMLSAKGGDKLKALESDNDE